MARRRAGGVGAMQVNTITMLGSKPGQEFQIVNTAGAMTYPCKEPGTGGCPTGGWGK